MDNEKKTCGQCKHYIPVSDKCPHPFRASGEVCEAFEWADPIRAENAKLKEALQEIFDGGGWPKSDFYHQIAKQALKKENPMDNGCPQCEQINGLCLDCQCEQADADVVQAMSRREELERKKEKQNELSSQTR